VSVFSHEPVVSVALLTVHVSYERHESEATTRKRQRAPRLRCRHEPFHPGTSSAA